MATGLHGRDHLAVRIVAGAAIAGRMDVKAVRPGGSPCRSAANAAPASVAVIVTVPSDWLTPVAVTLWIVAVSCCACAGPARASAAAIP